MDLPEIENQGQDNVVFSMVEQNQCISGKDEIKGAIDMLKNNKSPGEDMIGTELLKTGG